MFHASIGVILFALATQISPAQSNNVTLDSSEALFTVLTALNTCGYDVDLAISDPVRGQIRDEVAAKLQASELANSTSQEMCQFYERHNQADPLHNAAQYISLALMLNPPPALTPRVKDSDLPPDASGVEGILPLVQKFYEIAGLHAIWTSHSRTYADYIRRYHAPLAKMLFDTEVYLKLPSAGYLGHNFTIYVDPMGAPGQTNARNYGADYYVVISPQPGSPLKMQQIRHTYLHYLLDPLAQKYASLIKNVDPLLENVKASPMDDSFKKDSSLLVTECLIRAVEARTSAPGISEAERLQAVDIAVHQGFILTRYFYDTLIIFEKDPAGLKTLYPAMIAGIDIRKEQRQASQIQFAARADPELLHLAQPLQVNPLISAEQKLSVGDANSAQKLAQQALDQKTGDQGRALFILAQVATMNRDINGARDYFQKALEVAQEPMVVAWSHIYLGRIFDLQEDREAALDHYKAAITASADLPEAKAAAERGLEQPYEPPTHR